MPELNVIPQVTERRDYRLLIIEDDATIAGIWSLYLRHAFEVEVVGTFAAAVERLNDLGKPKAHGILLDLHLPNGAGLALIGKLIQLCPRTPIVVITGMDYSPGQVIQAGAQDMLAKTEVTQPLLLRTLARAIARHQVRSAFSAISETVESIKEVVSTKPPSDPKKIVPVTPPASPEQSKGP